MEQNKNKKVVVIGWDAADWKIINKLIDKGEMPTLERLINNGVMGNLATLEPPFSPMLWTSIATGKRPDKHGILGFVEPMPDSIGIRPVSSTSRKVKAIWNILNQNGYKPSVVGWWPSHPAEPINGIMISNLFQQANVDIDKWKVAKGMIHPHKLAPLFQEIRVHPSEITEAHLLPFVPKAAEIDQDKDKRLYHIAKNLAEAASIHSAATWIMEHQEWDFMAIYLDSIDHFCHGFMNYYPPKLDFISDDLYEKYKEVIDGIYKFHDMMLERIVKLAGEETTIMLISDHGFHSDHLRPKLIPDEPAGPAYQHREHGIFCVSGPGIKKDERIYGASLLDITPTILAIYGLPYATDMDGIPLLQIFENNTSIETIASWELIDGETGMHPKEILTDPIEAQEAIKQLVELGYIEDPGENQKEAAEKAIREEKYNLARVYMGAQKYQQAASIFNELINEIPNEPRFVLRLAICNNELGNFNQSKQLLETFNPSEKKHILSNKDNNIIVTKLNELKLQYENSTNENIESIEKEIKELNAQLNRSKLAVINGFQAELLLADIYIKEDQPELAINIYEKLKQELPAQKKLFLQMGNALLKLKEWEKAEYSFKQALELDNNAYQAYHGIAICKLRTGLFEEAAENALTAIGLMYYVPRIHYHLAEALIGLKDYDNAINALKICLNISPNYVLARNAMIKLYEDVLNQPEKAKEHREYYEERVKQKEDIDDKELTENNDSDISVLNQIVKRKQYKQNQFIKQEPIIVVSGLPRSGTSLMMQILDKAGIELFTDNTRMPDENNPKGYYEHQAVMRLARDNKWLEQAKGKAVKIISHLLFYLPQRYHYKIIFMERDLNEIIQSQHKMLVRLKKIAEDTYPANIEISFKKNLERTKIWHYNSPNVEMLYINHHDLISNPEQEISKLFEFLNVNSNIQDASKVIDKQLYREKNV